VSSIYINPEKIPEKGFSNAILFINIFVRKYDIGSGILKFPVTIICHQYVFFKEQKKKADAQIFISLMDKRFS
jgi:hypothetical protein